MAFDVAEPCSRLRKFGGALSERSEFAPPPESANRAGNPKGYARATMAFRPFANTKDLMGWSVPRGEAKWSGH